MHIDKPLDETIPLVIPLSLCIVARYFSCGKHNIADWEYDRIPRIDLMAADPPWENSDSEHLALEDQIIESRVQVLDRYPYRGGGMVINML